MEDLQTVFNTDSIEELLEDVEIENVEEVTDNENENE